MPTDNNQAAAHISALRLSDWIRWVVVVVQGGAANPFGNILGRLATHPKFSTWMSDPTTVQKINMMQQNPQSIEMMLQVRTGWFSKVARNISVQRSIYSDFRG